jgi:hypothetical protein
MWQPLILCPTRQRESCHMHPAGCWTPCCVVSNALNPKPAHNWSLQIELKLQRVSCITNQNHIYHRKHPNPCAILYLHKHGRHIMSARRANWFSIIVLSLLLNAIKNCMLQLKNSFANWKTALQGTQRNLWVEGGMRCQLREYHEYSPHRSSLIRWIPFWADRNIANRLT